mgnify:CR=1 FL=1|jgi:hypothetical protein
MKKYFLFKLLPFLIFNGGLIVTTGILIPNL